MIIISHRGNISGPNPSRENHPTYIDEAIQSGYQVEVDIRYLDKKWYLGHDGADYKVSINWMKRRNHHIWWHAKSLDTLVEFGKLNRKPLSVSNKKQSFIYFWHQSDDYTLTSFEHIWTFPNKPIRGKQSIIVLNEEGATPPPGILGICTDYPEDYKNV